MSSTATPPKSGATFLWVLGSFASFAVLFVVIQNFAPAAKDPDPRAADRLEKRLANGKSQGEILAKMGLTDAAKKDALFTKALESFKAKKEGASTQVVPGSPTQLKQAGAAAAPAAAPTPAAPAAPATK